MFNSNVMLTGPAPPRVVPCAARSTGVCVFGRPIWRVAVTSSCLLQNQNTVTVVLAPHLARFPFLLPLTGFAQLTHSGVPIGGRVAAEWFMRGGEAARLKATSMPED